MKLHNSILNVADGYEGILLDAYGVFWGGNAVGLFPGVLETLSSLVSKGKIVGVLSNATQLPLAEMEKIAKTGLQHQTHFHFYVTSGDIARSIFMKGDLPFSTPKKKYFLFSGVHPRYSSPYTLFKESLFQETDQLEEADFIYLSTPHLHGEDQTDPELFRKLVEAVAPSKLPMVCANPDRFAHEGKPARTVVRQGSIAAFYEELGGTVFYIGKPSRLSFEVAMKQFNHLGITDPAKVLMVGDTPETDILGANRFGMASALIIETGIMKDRKLELQPQLTPTHLIKKLAPDV